MLSVPGKNKTHWKKISVENIKFALCTTGWVLLTHAIAYLLHEYCHSFPAWLLGFKKKPLDLEYGHFTLKNILLLNEVEEKVDYSYIFSNGHGLLGGLIALAGAGLGNGLVYFICYWLAGHAAVKSNRLASTFLYWLSLMSAANLFSYAPLRVITTHGDMSIAAQGFGISTWLLFPFVTAGALYLMYHFFYHMFPRSYQQVSANMNINLLYMIVTTSYWYFGFYGSDGSTFLPIINKYFMMPFSVILLVIEYMNLPHYINGGGLTKRVCT